MSANTPAKHKRLTRTDEAVLALESRGLLDPARHDEAVEVLDGMESGEKAAETAGLRRVLAEVAGYVGAAFVVAAIAVFLAPRWLDLSLGVRVGLLLGAAVLLGAAGVAVGVTGGGMDSLRSGGGAVRRRLASTLFTGAAVAAAAAVAVYLDDWVGDLYVEREPYLWLGAGLTATVLSAVGYLLAPTLLGQVAVLVGLLYSISFAWDAVDSSTPVRLGVSYLVVGALWLLLAERRVWREPQAARILGSALVLVGAQAMVFGDNAWLGYATMLLVGIAGFVLYAARRAWPYLALGVVAVTLAVPEALLDWTEGSMGTALALLAAGATLLVASLVGLRLRHAEAGHATG